MSSLEKKRVDKTVASEESDEIDWGGSGANQGEIKKKIQILSKNVHIDLPDPHTGSVKCSLVVGDYLYFHYGCDGQDDRGWGCGYRTIQTMASWLCHNWSPIQDKHRPPPSLPEIQQALVCMGDKPESFSCSKEWIGTFEASLVLDFFYDVPCKVVHVRGGGAELEQVAVEELHQHFQKHGSPVMMGGDRDNSSKGILGVCTGDKGSYLLVLDPHYFGGELENMELQRRAWVTWKKVSSLDHSSFYNLCMPQTGKNKHKLND
ncbi:inactive Ufm1-specific protease 1 [Labrus bergylta]|uniref:inactive Ufm1-specific protease 1 n=1 Tax=Labrus bergylta TaxID=56723 RepID=UPI0009B4CF07|nr:inactive Ufm1-specific protease 1 [Labrus bergylta]